MNKLYIKKGFFLEQTEEAPSFPSEVVVMSGTPKCLDRYKLRSLQIWVCSAPGGDRSEHGSQLLRDSPLDADVEVVSKSQRSSGTSLIYQERSTRFRPSHVIRDVPLCPVSDPSGLSTSVRYFVVDSMT